MGKIAIPILRKTWQGAMHRCHNPTNKDYPGYGGRGITVCRRWRESFWDFAEDMGDRPDGHSLDRRDNDAGYWCGKPECPECGPAAREPNCRWAPPGTQAKNRRRAGTGDGRLKPKRGGDRYYLSGTGRVPWFKDITGHRYHDLDVLWLTDQTRPASPNVKLWLCVCKCGGYTFLESNRLRIGRVRSCGCLKKGNCAKRKKVMSTRTSEYRIWCGIQQRCYNPNHHAFNWYGGRGIGVCDRWREDFNHFIEDMGARPSADHSLDRIDPNGHYSPDNCRWATDLEQGRNKRNTNHITHGGLTLTIPEWAERTGIPYQTIYHRLKKQKLPPAEALV